MRRGRLAALRGRRSEPSGRAGRSPVAEVARSRKVLRSLAVGKPSIR